MPPGLRRGRVTLTSSVPDVVDGTDSTNASSGRTPMDQWRTSSRHGGLEGTYVSLGNLPRRRTVGQTDRGARHVRTIVGSTRAKRARLVSRVVLLGVPALIVTTLMTLELILDTMRKRSAYEWKETQLEPPKTDHMMDGKSGTSFWKVDLPSLRDFKEYLEYRARGMDISPGSQWTVDIVTRKSPKMKMFVGRQVESTREFLSSRYWPFRSSQTVYTSLDYPNCDLCNMIIEGKVFAPVETERFRQVLSRRCKEEDAVVVDVGANIGYFSTLAALHGCRVVAIEPGPTFRTLLYANADLNGVTDKIRVFPGILSVSSEPALFLCEDNGTQWGLTQIVTHEKPGSICHPVSKAQLHQILHEDAILVKVDTEGAELDVMAALDVYLTVHRVDYFIVEIKDHASAEKRNMIRGILSRGYGMCNFRERYHYAELDLTPSDYSCYNVTQALHRFDDGDLVSQGYRAMWGRATEDFMFYRQRS